MPYVVLVIVLLLILCGIRGIVSVRRDFRYLLKKIDSAESEIDSAIDKRYNALCKLVSFAADNGVTLPVRFDEPPINVSVNEKAQYNSSLDNLFETAFSEIEKSDSLSSDRLFKELQQSVLDIENLLVSSKNAYNKLVSLYNQNLKLFPSNIIADSMSLKPADFFDYNEEKPNIC